MADKDLVIHQSQADGKFWQKRLAPAANSFLKFNGSKDPTTTTDVAPLASPAFTGNPTAPTQSAGDSSTKLATTQFVTLAIAAAGGGGGGGSSVETGVAYVDAAEGNDTTGDGSSGAPFATAQKAFDEGFLTIKGNGSVGNIDTGAADVTLNLIGIGREATEFGYITGSGTVTIRGNGRSMVSVAAIVYGGAAGGTGSAGGDCEPLTVSSVYVTGDITLTGGAGGAGAPGENGPVTAGGGGGYGGASSTLTIENCELVGGCSAIGGAGGAGGAGGYDGATEEGQSGGSGGNGGNSGTIYLRNSKVASTNAQGGSYGSGGPGGGGSSAGSDGTPGTEGVTDLNFSDVGSTISTVNVILGSIVGGVFYTNSM